MADRPALLGGSAVFPQGVPLVRPTLPEVDTKLLHEVGAILAGGLVTKGPWLAALEERCAELMGTRHVVGVSSCTLGLLLAYQGLGLVGEVIVPSFTFMATVHPLALQGITPVFADIDDRTWNLDPDRVREAITERTTGVVAVHNFGNPAPVEELESIARAHGLRLVFDAAHGFGARHRGRQVGGFGDAEAFSMSPTKLVVAGEGGVVSTNDDELARHLRLGREYGNPGDYGSEFPGLNARLPEISAYLALRGVESLEWNSDRRRALAQRLRGLLRGVPGLSFQAVAESDECSYKDLSVRVDTDAFGLARDDLAEALSAEGVDTRRYHDPPVHEHRAYRTIRPRSEGRLPVTERLARECLTLPLWSHMDEQTVDGIAAAVTRIHAFAPEIGKVVARRRESRPAGGTR